MLRSFLLLLLTASVLLPARAQAPAALHGRVTDARSGEPLAGVNLLLSGAGFRQGASSDADGRYAFGEVPPGTYRLEASMVGYERAVVETVQLQAGARRRLDVRLEEVSYGLEEVVVSATRMATPVGAVSGAVTVLGRTEIVEQTTLGRSLGDALGKLVPGLGVSTGTPSIYGQSLRGRTISVLIDGVPQSTTRNTSRDLTTIDPSMIERIEVIRGATAIYGDGATGGIINIITRRAPGTGTRLTTDVNLGGSLSAPGEGFRGRLTQTAAGRSGALDYTASASYGRTGGFYDASGDLIPPDPYGQGGYAYTASWDLHGRVGYTSGAQRLQLTLNRFESEQDTEFTTDPSVNALPPHHQKAGVIEGLQLAENQGSYNTVASLDYNHVDLLGTRLHAQVFYRDYLTRFSPFDGRPFATYRQIIQSYLDSQKYGARMEIEKKLHEATGLQLLAGFDYTDERTQQPVAILDSTTYDQSRGLVFEKVGERPWVPLLNPRQFGLFAQLSWQPLGRLDLQGGLRYERARMHVDDFTTLVGNRVNGGQLAYDPVLFNVGAVLHTTDATSVYASFSQGFSLTDLGLYLRNAPDGFEVGNRTLKAQKVNSVEAGARGGWTRLRASLAGFYNESNLGTTSAGIHMNVVRAPERVYGVEATLDLLPLRAVALGGTFTWTEGENDVNEDGVYLALNSFRIQPLKVTGYVEHQTRPHWKNRLQVLYSGVRDRAYNARLNKNQVGFGEHRVDSYLVVDLLTTLQIGPGTFRAGIENLLNSQYFPVVSQLLYNGRNSSYAAAPGAALTLGYTVTY